MPEPYTFTSDEPPKDFTFEPYGPINLDGPSRVFRTNDPCEAVRFLNALQKASGTGFTGDSQKAYDDMVRWCGAKGGGEQGEAPPTPPPVETPAATGPDAPPPADGEAAESLGAPDPKPANQAQATPAAPGEPDGRTLQEQHRDPQNPMPDYDIASNLESQGVPSNQIADAVQRVVRNDPPPAQPHPVHGQDDTQQGVTAVDPVDVFGGRYSLTVTDVEIASRGIPLRLTRIYRSGEAYFGPWGYNWDHNYNLYVRELANGGVAVWTGRLSEDVYEVAPEGFESPTGVFRRLEFEAATPLHGDRYVITERDGVRFVFERPPGWPNPERIPLVRVEDRHGNAHELSYIADGRLAAVTDHAERRIEFLYGDCGLLEEVRDHTGRRWHYRHDETAEHLVSVTTPPTPEYPDGLTTTYEYDVFRTHPGLIHNLTSVRDPTGQILVENLYGDDPGAEDFARVVEQRFGGFEATFHATRLQLVPRMPDAINVPALRVEVVDPGVLRVYTFNYRGDLLDDRFRLVADGSYRLVARTYRYDEQGNMSERREPNGLGMVFVHDTTNADPLARRNLLRAELVAPPSRPAPSRIVQRLTYEPQFHRLKTLEDELGRTTTWEYDYENAPGGVGDVVAIAYPDASLPGGTTQSRRETFEFDASGCLLAHTTGAGHRHEFDYSTGGTDVGFLTSVTWDVTGASQRVEIEYDALGRRTAIIDGLGNRTETGFDALDRLVSVRRPGPVGSEIRYGYTPDGRISRHERPKGSFDDAGTPDPFLLDTYEYDAWGHMLATTYGANTTTPLRYAYEYDGEGQLTTMRDPLGTTTVLRYDERGRILSRIEAAGTPDQAEDRYTYDRNGNQLRVLDPVGHTVNYEYDAWDRLTRTRLPGTAAERTTIGFTLDDLDHWRRITIEGLVSPGVTGVLFDAVTDYDERGRPWRRTVGDLVSVITYDADERTVLTEDHRGGQLALAWDGLNRVTEATDAEGNIEMRGFDEAGSLVKITSRENGPGGLDTLTTTIDYDERRRPVAITAPFGRVSQIEYDARDLAVASVDPLGVRTERTYGLRGEILNITAQAAPGSPVTTRMAYDPTGRLSEQIDGEGRVTSLGYDRRDRRTSITYPDGRVHRFSYGLRRQLEQERLPGGTVRDYSYAPDASLARIDVTPGPGLAATPPVVFAHDGLRRLVRAEHGGHVLVRRHDDSLRIVAEDIDGRASSWSYDDVAGVARFTYPDGRVDRVELDLLGRPVAVTLEAVGGGALTGGLAPDTELARWRYAGPGRVAERRTADGTVMRVDYDAARRVTAIVHEDSSGAELATVRLAHDASDRRRVVWMGPQPLFPRRVDFDGVSRVVAVADGLPLASPDADATQTEANAAVTAAEAAGAATETFELNGADVRTERRVTAVSETDTYGLDAAWQIASVTRSGGGVTVYAFDGDGRCVQDNRYRYVYDGLGRLVEVADLAGLKILTQTSDPVGRPLTRATSAGMRTLTYSGLRLVEWDDDGVPAGQLSYGRGIDEVAAAATGVVRFPLLDPASSILAWTDDAGAVVERYRYDVFGAVSVFAPDGTTARPDPTVDPGPAFGGHKLLVPGRYDARERVYDPVTGRFTTPDPLGYPDAGNLYVYAHHDPVDLVDPTGEVALLLGLAIAAGIGLVAGLGTNAIRQHLQIHERSRPSFSWGEMVLSGVMGAVAAPVLVLVPELVVPLAAYGIEGGISEFQAGHSWTGGFDIVTSVLPFGSKSVRAATFGRGSVWSLEPGPIATPTARVARLSELGLATQHLAGRLWNERYYHGTSYYAALEAEQQSSVNLTRVRDAQLTNPAPPVHGPGLYFGREPGAPNIPGSPEWWAGASEHGGGGRGGGPAVLEASIPRWKAFLLRREPGVVSDVPQQGFPASPASREAVFPLDGPRGTPPTGPGVEFNAAARWRLWDPHAVAPSPDALWPALASPVSFPPSAPTSPLAPSTTK